MGPPIQPRLIRTSNNMRLVAAYLLAVLGGKANPTEKDVTAILSSVGVEADSKMLKKLVSELNGKNLEELMEAGREKFAAAGVAVSGGGAAGGDGGAAGGDAPAAAKEEEKEESDDDMGFGLFD